MGIYTSVDDFGMGYSTLTVLRDIPWDVLKIDRAFLPVNEEEYDSNHGILFKHVIALADEMGIESVAEGVETKFQLDMLRKYHCDMIQGFYFDKPLPVEEFETRFGKNYYEG